MSEQQLVAEPLDVRLLLNTLVAVKKGDFSVRLPADWTGLNGKIADTLNDIIELDEKLAVELERASKVVGKEGKMGHHATLHHAGGLWAGMIDSLNTLVADLARPTGEMARVIGAVARGDLSQSVPLEIDGRPLEGEFLRTGKILNTMVDRLSAFASEVTRVAREVGTDGKLGGQAKVEGVSGTWKDLTDNVNVMAANLTDQVRNIAEVTTAVAKGDLTKKITVDARGEILALKDPLNIMVDQLNSLASEVSRVSREVGTDGKLGGQAKVEGVSGTWKNLTDSVNLMAANLTSQVRDIAQVTTAVATGDLTKKITVDARGEILDMKNTINTMVDQLSSLASEVTRVSREVGTDGKLGGQAKVEGVSGTWKNMTDTVNLMAANLTDQVRGIAKVVTAVADGNLKLKLTVPAKGEIAALAETINGMIDTLATLADQVTAVAREVGVEGKLGGQAQVPGAAGTWKDLTDNVNQLAANLTTQVRAIAVVATAVTKGDLTRSVKVEAQGELAALKDNINEMIRNLRDTTDKNAEQDWLKTNLAKFSRMLQGQKDVVTVSKMILSELAPVVSAQHGVLYMMDTSRTEPHLKLQAAYAYKERKNLSNEFELGEGLVGQCAVEKERILLTNVPPDYIQISSGLGEATPLNIIVLPIVFEGQVKAVLEMASFERFSVTHQAFLDQLAQSIGIVLNIIEANMRTEDLLKQSQLLAEELQSQQEELRQTNEELEEKARLLEDQKTEVEGKNREVELARAALEDKAEQLALTSKYKSEFLSNMSHELRTPLNSLLILAQQLSDNPEGNLNPKQVKFAQTIHSSGGDLLTLINDILDLSKIESGKVSLDIGEVSFAGLGDAVERTFSHIAENKGLRFQVEVDPGLPRSMRTDETRLQQLLKNLLSNAFKFTEKGGVTLHVSVATGGWSFDHDVLNSAGKVIAFSVTDTGIGIPAGKQKIIFEAFRQADGTTGRKYGGTGLGLSISRELARLLGGELCLASSTVSKGSTFVFYLPQTFVSPGSPEGEGRSGPGGPPGRPAPAPAPQRPVSLPGGVADDRSDIQPGDRALLIVEDDARFAEILLDMARQKGFKGLVAARGDTALDMAREFAPTAITLDIRLPDTDGWTVLDRLKLDPRTRHIPVHIITVESERGRGLQRGAFAYLEKPVSKKDLDEAFARLTHFVEGGKRRLLVVEDDPTQQQSIVELLGDGDIEVTPVGTGKAALAALRAQHFDCIVLDLQLPDISGFKVMEAMQEDPNLREVPVIVYTGKELTRQEEAQLKKVAKTIILKDAQSPERLLDETALFLHRVAANLPEPKRRMLEKLYQSDSALMRKKVLIVDDDVRNIFALTSLLERHGMEVVSAENGERAIEVLEKTPGIDVVLMDVMMPDMDGYETTRAIRKVARFKKLPIIALTAKAMKGDRERCIEAGASDYITKPVDTDQLLSLLRVWLYR